KIRCLSQKIKENNNDYDNEGIGHFILRSSMDTGYEVPHSLCQERNSRLHRIPFSGIIVVSYSII
ncbi:MAG: hypothetical protein PHT33_12055, partial [bacterium]|nr:hypothetical protein [bacterium]